MDGMFYQPPYKSMVVGKSLAFRIVIKSVVDQKSFKLGVMILLGPLSLPKNLFPW